MSLHQCIESLLQNGNPQQAEKMRAYMRNQFDFLGIPAPQRKILCRPYFKVAKNDPVDWTFIRTCWDSPWRKLQYTAVDYLTIMETQLTLKDIPALRTLAITKSWWDTIDGLDRIVGAIALNEPSVNLILLEWSTDNNIWLRRIAIDHQLLRKNRTDTDLLETIIVNNLGHNEFFIQKAIGWSLRDYSKTNPDWVQSFIDKYRDKLAPLSIREASKYLK
jgi:3-methyladenine DNA glycosylase AlkD